MRRLIKRGFAGVAIAAFVLWPGGGYGPGISQAHAQQRQPTPVKLRMDVFFYGAHVPLLLGIVDGIYKKYGLDVTAETGRGSATTIQTVANGSDDFGFADGGTLAKLVDKGLKAKMIV